MTTIPYKTPDIAPLAVTGNGYSFRIALRKTPVRDLKGRLVVAMLVYPSKACINHYGLKPQLKYLDEEAMWVYFPKSKIIDTWNIDPSQVSYIVLCGFMGERTELENHYGYILEQIEQLQKQEQDLRIHIAVQRQEILKIKTRPQEYLQDLKKMKDVMAMKDEEEVEEKENEPKLVK